jgi:hypothetical protein
MPAFASKADPSTISFAARFRDFVRKNRTAKELGYHVLHHFGLRWVFWRAVYLAQKKTGLQKLTMPKMTWDNLRHRSALPMLEKDYLASRPFFFMAREFDNFHETAKTLGFGDWVVSDADRIATGVFPFFSSHWLALGTSPNWHENPFAKKEFPRQKHFSEIDDFAHGDVKLVWELSRFSFAYTLARAYLRTKNERYARRFLYQVEDLRAQHQPKTRPKLEPDKKKHEKEKIH